MKNKILKYILVSAIFIMSVCSVYATDSLSVYDMVDDSDLINNEFDSTGHIISGSVFWSQSNSADVPNIQTCFNFFMPNQNGSLKCIYCLYDSNKSVYRDKYTFMFMFNSGYNSYRNYQKWYSYNEISEAYQNDEVYDLLSETVSPNNYTDPRNGTLGTDYEVVTNIPIFNYDDTTHINLYINDGSLDDCLNINDVIPPPEIPYPTNISLSKTSKQNYGEKYFNPIVVSWDAGSNSNYNYQNMRFSVSYEAIYGYQVAGAKNTVSSGVKNVAQHVKYQNENQTYTLGVDNLNENLTLTISNLIISTDINIKSKWLNSITIYIQNEDDQNFSYVSSIKYVAYDFVSKVEDSSNTPVDDDGSVGGGESDGESSGTGDGTINNPSSNGSSSNTFTGTIKQDYPKWDLYNNLNNVITGKNSIIRDYIDNDFALFGSNPLFSVLGSVMPYMPVEYFNLLKLTMSVGCGMAVVGIIFRFLRG